MVHPVSYRPLHAETACSDGSYSVLVHSLPHRDGHAHCRKLGEVLNEAVDALQAAVDTVHEDVLPTLLLAGPAQTGWGTAGQQGAACGPAPCHAGWARQAVGRSRRPCMPGLPGHACTGHRSLQSVPLQLSAPHCLCPFSWASTTRRLGVDAWQVQPERGMCSFRAKLCASNKCSTWDKQTGQH